MSSEFETETVTETETLSIEDRAANDAALDRDLAELVEGYLQAGDADAEYYMAAFEAGTLLRTVEDLEIWDPIDNVAVRLERGEMLTVASHEGDVLVGELADNSHSIGVVYEEAHRWYQRKYFLPVALLTNRERIEINPEVQEPRPFSDAPLKGNSDVKGMAVTGDDQRTAVAVRRIEDLDLRDDVAFLPRGVRLIFRKGATAIDPATGSEVVLPEGTEADVSRAVGDVEADFDAEIPNIQITVGERHLQIPFAVIAELDPDNDVLTLDNIAKRRQTELDRRTVVRRMVGVGVGVGLVGATVGSYFLRRGQIDPEGRTPQLTLDEATTRPQARLNHRVASALVPQIAAVYGYFTAGNQYWWTLRGALMDLREQGAAQTTTDLAETLSRLSAVSSSFWEIYSSVYHRRVHVGWREIRHYRTDKDGGRHYSHSSYVKHHRRMWIEPAALDGQHRKFQGWNDGDEHRAFRARKLTSHPLYDILAADPAHPERTFAVDKRVVGFGRDAAVSFFAMALMTLPPSFYDELVGLFQGAAYPNQTGFGPVAGFFPYQKEALTLAGLGTGVVLAQKYQRRLGRRMAESKYELGQTLEAEIRRVPSLDMAAAFRAWFGGPTHQGLVTGVASRTAALEQIRPHLGSYHYTYGSGRDHGRSLDSVFVDPTPIQRALPQIQPQWPRLADQIAGLFGDGATEDQLLATLRNAIGTETVESKVESDRRGASGASTKRSLWLAAPVCGAAMLDALLKSIRG
ncbi:MAG: hypothetical protein ACI9MR_004349 [Myxococcota bacterium]|jgi:hypothetical protein